jgi:hypothetical protein
MATNIISAHAEEFAAGVYNKPSEVRGETMPQTTANYRRVLKEARQLPLRARHQLAEDLLRPDNGDEQTILISMRRMHQDAQSRFQDLMERNNEGQLASGEREELEDLVARYNAILLLNTEALLKANCPELFTPSGRLSRRRLVRSLRQKPRTGKNGKKPSSTA